LPVLILAKSFYVLRLQTQDVSGTTDVQVCIAAVVICLLMAKISWHLLEQPFLKLKKRFPSGQETVSEVTANAAGQPSAMSPLFRNLIGLHTRHLHRESVSSQVRAPLLYGAWIFYQQSETATKTG
jgi:hypothetical protein